MSAENTSGNKLDDDHEDCEKCQVGAFGVSSNGRVFEARGSGDNMKWKWEQSSSSMFIEAD